MFEGESVVKVKGPIRGYYYPHKAICVELESLEKMNLALNLRSTGKLEELKGRISFLKQFFRAHEDGEEASLYPTSDNLEEGISKPFEWDRQRSEELFQAVLESIEEFRKSRKQSTLLKVIVNVAALSAFQGAHEIKEDEILLPLLDEKLDPKEQGQVIGKAMSKFPPSAVEDVEKFLIKRITQEDRVDFLKMIKESAPPEMLETITKWVREVLSEEEWKELQTKMQ